MYLRCKDSYYSRIFMCLFGKNMVILQLILVVVLDKTNVLLRRRLSFFRLESMVNSSFIRPFSIIFLLSFFLLTSVQSALGKSSKQEKRRFDGIDVSHHQGKVNWSEVAKNRQIQFVYIKATQGTTIKDEYYERNIREARKHGLRCGSYHYLSSKTPIRAQFRHFYRTIKRYSQDLIPMIDVEREGVRGWTRKQVQDSVAVFAGLIKKYFGKRPLIYSQANFYNSHLAPRFNQNFLFLGKYSAERPSIKGVGRHNIWQFSERGRVNGIRGFVDLDRFMSGTSIRDIRL